MSDKDINALISDLTQDVKPVKCCRHPLLRLLPFLFVAVIYIGGIFYFYGVRPDLAAKWGDSIFVFEVLLMAMIAISSALSSVYLSLPDKGGYGWLPVVPFTALGIFALWSIARIFSNGMPLVMPGLHMDHCMGEGVFMAIIPLAMLLVITRSGATVAPYLSAAMGVISAGAIGYTGLKISCSMDTVAHTLVSHLAPYLLIGALMGIFARKLFKW